jgi:ATP-dependent DNA helicase RecG
MADRLPQPDDPVQYLKGVGPNRAEVLAELGILTAGDLLFYFPRDLAHLPGREPIAEARKRTGEVDPVGGVLER